jgi:hypothetical protein
LIELPYEGVYCDIREAKVITTLKEPTLEVISYYGIHKLKQLLRLVKRHTKGCQNTLELSLTFLFMQLQLRDEVIGVYETVIESPVSQKHEL